MTRFLMDRLSKSQKNAVRAFIRRTRLYCVRKWPSFTSFAPSDLVATLRHMGVAPGDSILVHCSFGEEFGFRGSMDQLIDAFLAAVGSTGNLLMVSMPYIGAASSYLGQAKVFDVRKTPSAMGLVTEAFRRRSGVVRSANPMHPVLVSGPRAAEFVAGHESCAFSIGPDTPFDRLLQKSGKVIFFNTRLTSFTFYHFLEHRIRTLLPFPLYTESAFAVPVINSSGVAGEVRVFGYSDQASARRQDWRLHAWLRRKKVVRSARLGVTRVMVLDLQEVVKAFDDMIAVGKSIFDLKSR